MMTDDSFLDSRETSSTDFLFEIERILREIDKSETQNENEPLGVPDHNQRILCESYISETLNENEPLGVMQIGSRKRKEQCVKEKSTKKQRRTVHIGESSASQQQPKPRKKDFKEIVKEKSVSELIKILRDGLYRRIHNDERALMVGIMKWMSDQKLIQWPLPLQSDLHDILKMIEKIKSDNKNAADRFCNSGITTTMEVSKATDELKLRLVEVRQALENLNEQRRKGSEKTVNLQAVFANSMEVSVETLREKLSEAFPSLVLGEAATNGFTVDQGSLQTLEQLQSTFSYLQNQLYAMDNNKVDVPNFNGLKEALDKTPWGKTPDYLEPIAARIEKARGKATKVSHNGIQVLVCAAIQEMEELPLKNWTWDILKKWGATLNKAKELDFQVEFAENILPNNLYAYFAYSKNVG